MNLDDLLGDFAQPKEQSKLEIKKLSVRERKKVSPYVLVNDAWSRRLGEEALEESVRAQEYLEDYRWPQEAAVDFMVAAWEIEPHTNEVSQDPCRQAFVEALQEVPDFQALRRYTMLDTLHSQLAVTVLSEKFYELAQHMEGGYGKGGIPSGWKKQAVQQAAADAANSALQTSEAAQDMMDNLGITNAKDPGQGAGPGNLLDEKQIIACFEQIRGNAELRKIIDESGRYQRLARKLQKALCIKGYSQVVDVERDGDFSRLLGSELAMLAIEELEDLALSRIIERQALCRKVFDQTHLGKGPIIVFTDQSGSMSGGKDIQAKALSLTLYWVARHQRRPCILGSFSCRHDDPQMVSLDGHAGQGGQELLDWLVHFDGGGTSIDFLRADFLDETFAKYSLPRGKTDIVLITDGELYFPESEKFNAWKDNIGCRMISLIIDGRDDQLSEISDDVYHLSDLSLEQEGVQAALSIQ